MVYAKKGRGNAVPETVTIDGDVMTWKPLSEPRWTTDGYVGLRISVQVFEDGLSRRELIVEFPYTHTQHGRPKSWPHRPREFRILLEATIRQAMELGWDPNSRGRPFNIIADEDPDDPSLPKNFK